MLLYHEIKGTIFKKHTSFVANIFQTYHHKILLVQAIFVHFVHCLFIFKYSLSHSTPPPCVKIWLRSVKSWYSTFTNIKRKKNTDAAKNNTYRSFRVIKNQWYTNNGTGLFLFFNQLVWTSKNLNFKCLHWHLSSIFGLQ